jgi:hypothetical protein
MNAGNNLIGRQNRLPVLLKIVGHVLAALLAFAHFSCANVSHPPPTAMPEPLTSTATHLSPTSSAVKATTTSVPPPTYPTATDKPTPFPALEGIPPKTTPSALLVTEQNPQRTQYALEVWLDYDQHQLAVSQTITYVNRAEDSLFDLVFVIESNRQPGLFHLSNLSWGDGRPVEGHELEGAKLWLPLPSPLMPGAHVSLNLSYELHIPARAAPFGFTPRQTNLGDWYPRVPPYRAGQGWLAYEPAVAGEHLVYDVADYQVDINLAGSTTKLTIAASGLVETDENRHRYQLDNSRSFAWSTSSEYVVLTESAGSVTVTSYVFPEHLAAGETALRTSADALTVFSDLFHPYPRANLAIVEADFPDGMEYEGLYFLGKEYYAAYAGSPQGYLTAIAAHETSHQWWYGLVGNDQAIEPWLDEALATYSELLFYETVYPGLVDWWWEFRVKRFNPQGWVDSTIYDHNGFRQYVNAVYLRGALFLDEIRSLVGDEVLLAFLRDYAARGMHDIVTTGGFFAILAEHSSVDPSATIQKYLAQVE